MKKHQSMFTALLMFLALYSGCRQPGSTPPTGLSIIDALGRSISIPRDTKRVVSMTAFSTEMLFNLSCGDKVVGVDEFSTYPPQAGEKPCLGKMGMPNLEMLRQLQPDIVFAFGYTRFAYEDLEDEMSIVYIDPKSVRQTLETIKQIGAIVGEASLAEDLVAQIEAEINDIVTRTKTIDESEKPLVYCELGTPMKSCSDATFTGQLISLAGGRVIAPSELGDYPIVSTEYVIARDPKVILLSTPGPAVEEVKRRSGWQQISAVKEGRVYKVDFNLVTVYPRFYLQVEQFAKLFHPNLFE